MNKGKEFTLFFSITLEIYPLSSHNLYIHFNQQGINMTTIVSVRRGNQVVIGGDGQVSLGNTVMKGNARKVHRLYNNQVIAGFAGGTADAFTLLERFEAKLQAHQGNLERAAVELAKDWRTDRMLRKLEALLAVADKNIHTSLLVMVMLLDQKMILSLSVLVAILHNQLQWHY